MIVIIKFNYSIGYLIVDKDNGFMMNKKRCKIITSKIPLIPMTLFFNLYTKWLVLFVKHLKKVIFII